MCRLSYIVLLVLSILTMASTAFAAQMIYTFQCTVGDEAYFAGNLLDSSLDIDLVFRADTDDIFFNPDLGSDVLLMTSGTVIIGSSAPISLTHKPTLANVVGYPDGEDFVFSDVWQGGVVAVIFPTDSELGFQDVFEVDGGGPLWMDIDTSAGELDVPAGFVLTYSQAAVPLPSTLYLLSSALPLLLWFRRKLKSQL